ncbi:hypothetical protein [Methylosinus sp. LW3]|uniref:hypothetical protein n=1 Tax=Methylosinus sp. LW3 TaxID=107635 RepID=UPI000465AB1D|nr:hypothetical protein [Methylosinus sp. LW3]
MDKKTVGLFGAISALPLAAATPAAEARTLDEVMSPSSYAELLQPIPNAAALLKEAMAREASQPEPGIQTAQYYGDPYNGGYGYSYPYYRRWRHHPHHHHHHHHHGWGWGGGGYYYGPPRYHHHHHHHHHHHWNGGWW